MVEVLTGSKVKALEAWGLTRLSTYGILREMSQTDVLEVVKALLDSRLLQIEGSEYPVIQLTESGRAAMTRKIPVEMVFPLTLAPSRDFRQRHPSASPPSNIHARPGIQTPWGTRKSPGPTAEETWQLWRQGKTLFEIADARGLTRSTITGHLLQLMAEGRQIDISRIIPAERRKMIETAIAKAGNERLKPIKELLPDDVSYEDIRLVVGELQLKPATGNGSHTNPNH